MRIKAIFAISAAGLLASAPAVAQNEVAPANAAANTADANATEVNAVGGTTAMDMNTASATAPIQLDANHMAPIPEEKKGFPWGVIGLLGLLGLIPRRRG